MPDFRLELAKTIASFGKTGLRGERSPIIWNPLIGKESLKMSLGQVFGKSLAVFREGRGGSEHGLRGVFHVAFG
jgi:hypothetical protein